MFVIPSDRLPPGFAERIDNPPAEPSEPVPAATTVLLRDGADGPEALLLRRHHTSGFVPGAYVFPGGRVDKEDGDPRLLERIDLAGATPELSSVPADLLDGGSELRQAVARSSGADRYVSRSTAGDVSDADVGVSAAAENASESAVDLQNPDADPPPGSRLAALRELFEETGVLLARDARGRAAPDASTDARLASWRDALMEGRATLLDVAFALDLWLATGDLVYCAHWVTPVAERRRYDTRFFLAALPPGAEVRTDAREMTDALWLAPSAALERFRAGRLPMVFPTVRTLQALEGFPSVDAVLRAYRRRTVAAVLPRLVRTPRGVGIVVDGAGA